MKIHKIKMSKKGICNITALVLSLALIFNVQGTSTLAKENEEDSTASQSLMGNEQNSVELAVPKAASVAEDSAKSVVEVPASSEINMAGSGSESDPFQITDKSQLNKIIDNPSAHYILMNDIEFVASDFVEGGDFYDYGIKPTPSMSSVYGLGFEPIGSARTPFSGVFDGNNNDIIGLYHSIDTSSRLGLGLFAYAENAIIKNLNVVNTNAVNVSNVDIFTGGIVGYAMNTVVENCTVSGNIQGDDYTGGIVGFADEDSRVINCTNNANVSAVDSDYLSLGEVIAQENMKVGGIAGATEGEILDCTNNGSVTANIEGNSQSYAKAGGIVGELINGRVENSVNKATVISQIRPTSDERNEQANVQAGGIAAYIEGSVIKSCENTGDVTAQNSASNAYAGGIVGQDHADWGASVSDIANSHNTAEITASCDSNAAVGGIAGVSSGNINTCYNTGAVNAEILSATSFQYAEIGGIVGNSDGIVNTSYNNGAVNVTAVNNADNSQYFRVGGIVGRAFINKMVSNSYNTGDITVDNSGANENDINVGGVIGMLDNSHVKNSYNTGAISAIGYNSSGVGWLYSDRTVSTMSGIYTVGGSRILARVTDSINDTKISNYNNYTWRLTEAQAQEESGFVGFDFNSVWTMAGKADYLYPEQMVFNIDPNATITGISMSTLPTKVVYVLGEDISVDMGEITVAYSDGNSTLISLEKGMISGFDNQVLGLQNITVTYSGMTTSYQIEVKTANQNANDQVKEIIASLPTAAVWSEEEEQEVLNGVAEAAKILNRVGVENIRDDAGILESIKILEEMLVKAQSNLSIKYTQPMIDSGVSASTEIPAKNVEFYGLLLATQGGAATGSPDFVAYPEAVKLDVTQKVPTAQQGSDSVVLEIKAVSETTYNETYIANYNIYLPVTMKIYLNDNFAGESAVVEHYITESNQNPVTEYMSVPIKTDAGGKYIEMTVTKFSQFVITPTAGIEDLTTITGSVGGFNMNLSTTVTLYNSTDTEYSAPLRSTSIEPEGYWGYTSGEFTIGGVAAGTYTIVMEREGHIDYIVNNIVVDGSPININDSSNSDLMMINMYFGDVNEDNKINFEDISIIRNSKNFNLYSYEAENSLADVDGDGVIDIFDIEVISGWGNYNMSIDDCIKSYS